MMQLSFDYFNFFVALITENVDNSICQDKLLRELITDPTYFHSCKIYEPNTKMLTCWEL